MGLKDTLRSLVGGSKADESNAQPAEELRSGGVEEEDLQDSFPGGPIGYDPVEAPGEVEELLQTLKLGVADTARLASEARKAVESGNWGQAEELLRGRCESSTDFNLLGIAYAHLALERPERWQEAVDAFTAATHVEPPSNAKIAEENVQAIQKALAVVPSPKR